MKDNILSIIFISSILGADGFLSGLSPKPKQRLSRIYPLLSQVTSNNEEDKQDYLAFGMLISSFTDGMTESTSNFFKYSLASVLVMESIQQTQVGIEENVMFSPCNGPDIDLLGKLENGDELLIDDGSSREDKTDKMMKFLQKGQESRDIRVLYIPTAMYALRADSSNTPGKQRQRARADGKKRRNQLVGHIEQMLGNTEKFNILAATLDFDDGTIKQPTGSDDKSKFPTNGKDALTSWNPHVVYIEGGNTFWLYHCMDKSEEKYMELIKNACCIQHDDEDSSKFPSIYIGKSAGAIVAGKYVETATWKGWDDPSVVPEKETYDKWIGNLALDMVGGASIFPHMSDDWISLVAEKRVSSPQMSQLYCLEEWNACCVEGSKKGIFVN